MNTINLIGNLIRKPELKNTTTGKTVCDFTIAVNRNYTNPDGTKAVDYINCQIWGKGAENLVKYQDKGNKVGIVGNLRVDSYKDNNTTKYRTYVLVGELEFLSSKTGTKKESTEETKEVKNNDSVYEDFGNQMELTEKDFEEYGF